MYDFVLNLAHNPSPGSAFEKKARILQWLPNPALIRLLKAMKYDGLVLVDNNRIVCSVLFQRHGSALHMFSIQTETPYQNRGIAFQELKRFIEYAKTVHGITHVRLGAGKNPSMNRLYERFRGKEQEMGITLLKDGWVELKRPTSH